jgi:predicted DNA-binding ribbon-helix-helix protein
VTARWAFSCGSRMALSQPAAIHSSNSAGGGVGFQKGVLRGIAVALRLTRSRAPTTATEFFAMTSANKGRYSTVKHSTVINGLKTSVSLEKEFWSAQGTTVSAIIGAIELKRDHTNLCSALRLFVLDFYRKQLPPPE